MGQKDYAGKTLESINEVFSDIVNVFLFNGDEVVKEYELQEAEPRSQYKVNGKYHEQERDVAKYWNSCGIRLAFIGIENQTNTSRYMPLRVISYDGSAYRAQIPENEAKQKCGSKMSGNTKKKALYPAVSLVLYFGTKRPWRHPQTLREVLTIPDRMSPYVNDYKLNVVNVAFLDRNVIDKFKSDFWYVADYFWQLRNNKEYRPSQREIKHVSAVLQMMSAMTGDKRFEQAYNEDIKEKGGGIMGDRFLDQAENRGRREGRREGTENGIRLFVESYTEDGIADEVIRKKLINKFGLTEKQAGNRISRYGRKSA